MLFKKSPETKDEIIFLDNSIGNGCEWVELFNNLRIKNSGILLWKSLVQDYMLDQK